MRVNWMYSAVATGFVGAIAALTQPVNEVQADDHPPVLFADDHPVLAPKPSSSSTLNPSIDSGFEKIKKEQDERLQKLLDLPKEKAGEIATGLNDLSKFYLLNNFGDLPTIHKRKEMRQELLTSAGQKYEKLFLKILELLTDPKTQDTGKNNLEALKVVKPWVWGDVVSIQELVNVKEHLARFFEKNFQNCTEDVKDSITLMESSLALLEFAGNQKIDHQSARQYFSWLEKECNFVANEKNKTKDVEELQKALRSTLSEIVHNSYLYIPYNSRANYPGNIKLFEPLVNGYKVLINSDKSNPEVLSESLSIVNDTRGFIASYEARRFPDDVKKINDALVPLFESIVKGINNLPKSQERTDLLTSMFDALAKYCVYGDSNELKQSLLVEPLTKHYFSKKDNIGNIEEFNLFMNSILTKTKDLSQNRTSFPVYILLKLISENKEYFLAGINKSIECFKAQDTPGKLVHSQEMADHFNLFNLLHMLNIETDTDQGLRKEVRDWSRENVCEPIFGLFLLKFKDEKVAVEFVETRQEHYIHHENWTMLNELLRSMVAKDDYFANKLIDAVNKRLVDDTNPHNRKMIIATSGVIPFFDSAGNVNPVIFNFLRQRVISENSPQAIMGVGKLLADGIRNEHMSLVYKAREETYDECGDYDVNGNPIISEPLYLEYEDFFKRIENYNKGKITLSNLTKSAAEDLSFTPVQKFLLDLICLSEGDVKLFKKLTGKELIPPTFWKTYEDKVTGERVTVEITGSGTKEQRELDKKYRDGQYALISEKVDRSKQNAGDFRSFYQTIGNAREALAYSASELSDFKTTKTVPVNEPSIKGFQTVRSVTIDLGLNYKNSLVNLLNRKIGSYVSLTGLAHEVGSFIELCMSLESENPDAKDFVAEKLSHLKWRLFDDEYGMLKRPGKNSEERKLQLEFAEKVLDSAPHRQRRNYITYLSQLGFDERELINLKKELELLEQIK